MVDKLKLIVDNILKAEIIMGIIMLSMITLISCNMSKIVEHGNKTVEEKESEAVNKNTTVVIDPGHGGADPGKVGNKKQLEKDINLQISMKLFGLLQKQGYKVVMTRTVDEHLGASKDDFSKMKDLKARCQIISDAVDDNGNTILVSIHQNSFSNANVYGPQVFYYGESLESKKLANIMQNTLNEHLKIEKPRVQKENNSYYMLAKTECPAIIVECGFLSNPTESEKLMDENYQTDMAKTIVIGIEQYNMAISGSL